MYGFEMTFENHPVSIWKSDLGKSLNNHSVLYSIGSFGI